MKNSKKIIASALALATVISVTSCGSGGGRTTTTAAAGGGNDTPSGGAADVTTTTTAATTTEPQQTNETYADLQDAIAALDIDNSYEVTKKIKWLAWWDMDETSATWEAFKKYFGVPEEGNESYGDSANRIVQYTSVAYANRYDKLGQMISSGDPPDIFPFEIRYFPISAIRNMFQPVDGIVDTYASEYADSRKFMDKFMWNGKNYCVIAPGECGISTELWYRRSIMQEYGFDDPLELYQSGNWTWNEFREMLQKFQDNDSSHVGIGGWYISEGIVCSTGTPSISIEGGKLVSNLNTPAIERAMNFLEEMAREGWVDETLKVGADERTMCADMGKGTTLFLTDGTWFFSGNNGQYCIKKLGVEYDDFMFVPWPRDPQSDKYYAEFKNGCNMFVAGSTNIEGFKAYCACQLACSNDPTVKIKQREKDMRDYGWTEEVLDLIDQYPLELEPVFDFKNGISSRMTDDGSAMEQVMKYPAVNPDYHFSELRAEFEGQINADIAEANSTLG